MRIADCHPDRPHYAKGLCKSCYSTLCSRRKRERDPGYHKQWRLNNLEKELVRSNNSAYKSRLKHEFGLTWEERQEMLEKQGFRCAICGKSEADNKQRLAVDHNHVTGKIRGLLCKACNMALGGFRDDAEILYKAIKYLG